MTIRLQCINSQCRSWLRVKEDKEGTRIRCPKCGRSQVVPRADDDDDDDDDEDDIDDEEREIAQKAHLAKIQDLRVDARNTLLGLGVLAALPTMIFACVLVSGDRNSLKLDGVTFGLVGYSLTVASLAVLSGILCGMGMKIGRMLAFIPSCLLLLNFPIGTLLAVAVFVKINKRDFVASLK